MFKRIVLGVDGSEHAMDAVRAAMDLAEKSGGELLIVHVDQKEQMAEGVTDQATAAETYVQGIVELVNEAHVPVTSDLRVARYQDVAKEILDAAESFKADTIVVGSRGLGGLSGLLLGSVAHKVIQRAHCPVLVIR